MRNCRSFSEVDLLRGSRPLAHGISSRVEPSRPSDVLEASDTLGTAVQDDGDVLLDDVVTRRMHVHATWKLAPGPKTASA